MLQNKLTRLTIGRMRWIGVAILLTGIASLVFGIILLVAAGIAHNEEIEQLEMEGAPTGINELKDRREMIRDNRYDQLQPEEVHDFIESYLTTLYFKSSSPNDVTHIYTDDDFKWTAWHSLLIQEKGTSIALINLGHVRMLNFAGYGAVIASVGLILAGLVAIGLGPIVNQMRTAMAEPTRQSGAAPESSEEVSSSEV